MIKQKIMECKAGSHLYGTAIASSDIDTRGIFVASKKYYIGMNNVEQIEDKVNDTVHFELKKFLRLASQNNPNIIELLFVPKDKLIISSKYWDMIVKKRHLFVSKKCKYTFCGYAFNQLKKLQDNRQRFLNNNPKYMIERNEKRRHSEETFGYDTKYAMHLVRLITEGKELLMTGNITLPSPNVNLLLQIRNGEYTYEEFIDMVKDFEVEFNELYDKSPLQYSSNEKEINKLCQEIIENVLF